MMLNPAQRRAVEHPPDRPLRIIAGAGTGKTHVLAARFLHLVQREGLDPERILCLTFMRKAAFNMRARILRALRDAGRPVPRPESLWILNFDAAASRIVRDDLLGAGLPPDTRLMSDVERADLQDRVWRDFCANPGPIALEGLGRVWEQPDAVRAHVFRTLAELAMCGIGPEELAASLGDTRRQVYAMLEVQLDERIDSPGTKPRQREKLAAQRAALPAQEAEEAFTVNLLQEVGLRYHAARQGRHLLDFSDVLAVATAVVRRDRSWSARFDAILVDECQDTNGAQFRLLRALARDGGANVCVVGDRKQSIFAFRGARPQNVDELDGEPVHLTENYRSVAPILNIAYQAVHRVAPDDPTLVPGARNGQTPRPPDGHRVWFVRLQSESEEAAWIAEEVRRLLAAGVDPGAIVILVRTRRRFTPLALALEQAQVPYGIVDRQAAWDGNLLKTGRSILRAAADPTDADALVRLLQEPPAAWSDQALYDLVAGAPAPFAALAARGAPDGRLARVLAELADTAGVRPGAEFVSEALRRWGLLEHILTDPGAARSDFADLAKLYVAAARTFAAVPAPTLAEFLQAIDRDLIASRPDQGMETDPTEAVVRVSNVHQVKGLEFPVVFVAGLGASRFPKTGNPAPFFGYDEHLGFVQSRSWNRDPMVRWDHQCKTLWDRRDLEEEQRLLYVAMTRAQERLYLTTSTRAPKPELLQQPQYFVERLEDSVRAGTSDAVTLNVEEHAPAPDAAETSAINADRPGPPPTPKVDVGEAAAAARDRIAWRPSAPPPPEVVDLSFSQAFTYRQCPRKFEYRYVQRLPIRWGTPARDDEAGHRPDPGWDPRAYGTLVHRALELFHDAGAAHAGDADAALAVACAEFPGDVQPYRTRAAAILARYAAWEIARAPVAAREAPFVLELPAGDGAPRVRLQGQIDRVDRDTDGMAIWDYKSGSGDSAAYRMQLGLYVGAAERALGYTVVGAGIIALGAATEAEAVRPLLRADVPVDAAVAQVREAAAGVARADFALDERGRHATRPCAACDYRWFCADRRTEADA